MQKRPQQNQTRRIPSPHKQQSSRIPQSAHFYVSDHELDLQLLQKNLSKPQQINSKITTSKYLKIMFFSFEYNVQKWLDQSDPQLMSIVNDIVKLSPGYKSTQIIFVYYLLTSNLLSAFFLSLLYPLPYVLLFTYLGLYLQQMQQTQTWNYSILILIILTGVRSSVISLITQYALHIPQGKFNKTVFISTIIITMFFRNNYVYIILYIMSIFLSFYIKDDANNHLEDTYSNRESQLSAEEKIRKQYKNYKNMPQTYPIGCLLALLVYILIIWTYQRYSLSWQYLVLQQFIFIGLLNNTKIMLMFFPLLFNIIYTIPHLKPTDIIGLNYILPGSHIKPFFSFIGNDLSLTTFTLSYLSLYLPSILFMCIFLGYRKQFYTVIWDNSMKAIQAVSNGLILSTIGYMLQQEQCNFNSVVYSAVVILCVVKLYRMKQWFAAFLGIFLMLSRAGVLYLNKEEPFYKFVCLQEQPI